MSIESYKLADGRFTVAIASDKGRRLENEDSVLVDEAAGLVVLADGLGGLPSGAVASKLVCDSFRDCVRAGKSLEDAAWVTNELLASESVRLGFVRNMGSTVLALQWVNNGFRLLWVGDSFALTLFDGAFRSISRDHSEVSKMMSGDNALTVDEARLHPTRFILTQAMGPTSNMHLAPGINEGRLLLGERILLATDGFLEVFHPKELASIASSSSIVEEVVEDLMWHARARMVHDNFTLAVGYWSGEGALEEDRFEEVGYWSN